MKRIKRRIITDTNATGRNQPQGPPVAATADGKRLPASVQAGEPLRRLMCRFVLLNDLRGDPAALA
ncbi:hypothetical protein, partial [Streptosporangium roseum]|uniref:hypothetical protein n=1 Tax=Streptosporangium roseum TaxID=2001 RepID=UPI00332A537B